MEIVTASFPSIAQPAAGGKQCCLDGKSLLSSWLVDALVAAWDLTSSGGGWNFNQRWGEAQCNDHLTASNVPVSYEEEDRQPCNSEGQKKGVVTE